MAGGKNLVVIGKVAKPHGVQGQVKISYFGEDPSGFRHYREILIKDTQGALRAYEIESVAPHSACLILRLKGVGTREEADRLQGKEILVPREALPALEEDEYFWADIVGMTVKTHKEKTLGTVTEVMATGANDVLIVQGRNRELYLPITKEVVQKISLDARVIEVARMEGLWGDEDEI